MAENTEEKPPLPREFPGDVKSGSFRDTSYRVPELDLKKRSESAKGSWWWRFGSAKNLPEPVSSDIVVEQLSRQSSKDLAGTNVSPRPPPSPGRVGLPTVTLVEAGDAAKGKAETETKTVEPEGTAQETKTTKAETETPATAEEVIAETKVVETETIATEAPPSGQETLQVTSEQPTVVELSQTNEPVPHTQAKEQDTSKVEVTEQKMGEVVTEGIKMEESSSAAVVETEKKEEAKEDAAEKKEEAKGDTEKKEDRPTLAKTRTEGVGGSMKETSTPTKQQPKLRQTQTLAKQSSGQPSFFQRFFSFGAAAKPAEAKVETPKEDEKKKEETISTEPAPKVAESQSSVEDPSGSKSPSVAQAQSTELDSAVSAEQVVSIASGKREHTSSDLTQVELDELKALFISEMKQKGIDVEGKYNKSSSDFDTPLLFLLDLHTFAEMEHSTVKMEQLLLEKYGAGHSLVCEFNKAATQEAKKTETAATEGAPKEVLSTTGVKEGGLETVQAGSDEEVTEAKTAGSSSEARAETTAAVKGETVPPSETTAAGQNEAAPPVIPVLRDETKSGAPGKCFLCVCLFPKAE